ncbi:OmpA family protein [Oscillospiraceae bacterium PP1C4]
MARKKASEESSEGTWLNTYADMVTLLLTFFIMLFSMSATNNANKSQEVMTDSIEQSESAVQTAGGSVDIKETLPEDFDELYTYIKAYVEENKLSDSIGVEKGQGVVYIRFKDSIFFDPDRFELKSSSRGTLDFLGNCLKNVEDQIMTININGHTASVDNMYYPVSDWRLSSQRASSVAIFLADEKHLDPQKIIPIGYGKNYPIDTNTTAQGRKNNRRVDMMILSNDIELADKDLLDRFLTGTFDTGKYPQFGGSKDVLIP